MTPEPEKPFGWIRLWGSTYDRMVWPTEEEARNFHSHTTTPEIIPLYRHPAPLEFESETTKERKFRELAEKNFNHALDLEVKRKAAVNELATMKSERDHFRDNFDEMYKTLGNVMYQRDSDRGEIARLRMALNQIAWPPFYPTCGRPSREIAMDALNIAHLAKPGPSALAAECATKPEEKAKDV